MQPHFGAAVVMYMDIQLRHVKVVGCLIHGQEKYFLARTSLNF